MFFEPKLYHKTGGEYAVSDATVLLCEERLYAERIRERFSEITRGEGVPIRSVSFALGFPKSVRDKIGTVRKSAPCDEEYAIVIDSVTKFMPRESVAFCMR